MAKNSAAKKPTRNAGMLGKANTALKGAMRKAVMSPNASTVMLGSPVHAEAQKRFNHEMQKPIPGKATGMKKLVDNEDEEMDEGEEGGDETMNANSTQENEMKLKPEERAELVGNLTTNCDCWKHEGSDKVLNAMPDEQLVAVYNQSSSLREILPVLNQIATDFGVDADKTTLADLPQTLVANAMASFDGSHDGGGSDTRANGAGDDPDGDYDTEGDSERMEDEEGDYEGDEQTDDNHQQAKTGVHNTQRKPTRRNKPMTTNQWLATAPPEVQVVVRNALAIDEQRKEELIEAITANANNPYSEEQLYSMNTLQLEPLAQLAAKPQAPVRNQNNKPRQSVANFYGAQGAPRQTAPVNNAFEPEEGLLEVPTINWSENAKETRD